MMLMQWLARSYRLAAPKSMLTIKEMQEELSCKYPYFVYKDRFLVHGHPAASRPQLLWNFRRAREIQQLQPQLGWQEALSKAESLWKQLQPPAQVAQLAEFADDQKLYKEQKERHEKEIAIANHFHSSLYQNFVKMCYEGKVPEYFTPIKGTKIGENSRIIAAAWAGLTQEQKESYRNLNTQLEYQKFREDRQIPKNSYTNAFTSFAMEQAKTTVDKPKNYLAVLREDWSKASAEVKQRHKFKFLEEQVNFEVRLQTFLARHKLTRECLDRMRFLSAQIEKKKKEERSQRRSSLKSKRVEDLEELSQTELVLDPTTPKDPTPTPPPAQ